MPKKVKQPKDMTSDEAIANVFHPKVVEHLKRHLAGLGAKTPKRTKKPAK
jgi:hypothetical protein